MKKIILILIAFFVCVCGVRAEEGYLMWHNSIDNAYTTSYDGIISNEIQKYQNDTIESLGSYKVRLNNFVAYDVMLYKETTWELNGENTIDFIEESSNNIINLTGNGVLKFQEIGLSMNDMLNSKTLNLEERIKTYIKGDYILSIEENYIVLTINKKSNMTPIENNIETKVINFENKGFNITIKSTSKVPIGTVFIAENKMDTLKEEISEKLENEEVKYIYDFKLQDGEKSIEPTDDVEVSIKLNNGEYIVYYYNSNELEKIDSKYDNEYLTFNTNHFSEYVITSPREKTKEIIEDKKTEEGKDYTLIICGSIFVISIILLISVIIIGKKK